MTPRFVVEPSRILPDRWIVRDLHTGMVARHVRGARPRPAVFVARDDAVHFADVRERAAAHHARCQTKEPAQ